MMEFLAQGGYAFFVWGAFGVTFLLLIAEVLALRHSRRTILFRVGRLARLQRSQGGGEAGSTQGPDLRTADTRGETR